ncbi:MAG: hypothetical protein IVW52_19540 [Acidimicrobiales bacterium]|nr:hypothetical protein [Acidimicrobiales bacterium]
MRAVERAFRIVVASTLTVIFTAWSVHLFVESQPSEAPIVQIPKCPTNPPDQACIEHALKVAFSGNVVDHWSLWVIWVFWALIAVVWLAACALILWAPRRANNSVSGKLGEPSVDDPVAGSVGAPQPEVSAAGR